MLGIPCPVATQADLEWLQKAVERAPQQAVTWDSLLGAALYVFLKEYLALRWVDFHLLIFGALFIAIVLLLPGGLVQAADRLWRLVARPAPRPS
jgi:hypothetical protein